MGRLLRPTTRQGPRSTTKERNEDDAGESEPLQNISGAADGAASGGGGGTLWGGHKISRDADYLPQRFRTWAHSEALVAIQRA